MAPYRGELGWKGDKGAGRDAHVLRPSPDRCGQSWLACVTLT